MWTDGTKNKRGDIKAVDDNITTLPIQRARIVLDWRKAGTQRASSQNLSKSASINAN